ncbi:acetyl-CoA carboxylase biotin carboxyl carrier protein subunit [bacterium]|nr:acetyl-CoA carboxylase biotin carboxyl carrier protein subunit [bacterium]
MAGTVLEVKVKPGDKVSAGQEVAVVESMKMEVPLTASEGGVVKSVTKAVGDFLNEGETLVELQ